MDELNLLAISSLLLFGAIVLLALVLVVHILISSFFYWRHRNDLAFLNEDSREDEAKMFVRRYRGWLLYNTITSLVIKYFLFPNRYKPEIRGFSSVLLRVCLICCILAASIWLILGVLFLVVALAIYTSPSEQDLELFWYSILAGSLVVFTAFLFLLRLKQEGNYSKLQDSDIEAYRSAIKKDPFSRNLNT